MALFGAPRIRGPRGALEALPPVAEGAPGPPVLCEDPPQGSREAQPGTRFTSHRPEEEAVMATELYQPPWGYTEEGTPRGYTEGENPPEGMAPARTLIPQPVGAKCDNPLDRPKCRGRSEWELEGTHSRVSVCVRTIGAANRVLSEVRVRNRPPLASRGKRGWGNRQGGIPEGFPSHPPTPLGGIQTGGGGTPLGGPPGGPGAPRGCTFRRVFNNSPSRDKMKFRFFRDFSNSGGYTGYTGGEIESGGDPPDP